MGLEVKMPSFLKGNQRSSEETNEARLGTKIRCGVEIHHVRLKRFTLLQNTSLLEKIGPYIKMVTTMLQTTNFSIKWSRYGAHINKSLVKVTNELQTSVDEKPISSWCKWEKINETQMKFARMTENQLRELCFGVYQTKKARTYAEAHLNKNDGWISAGSYKA